MDGARFISIAVPYIVAHTKTIPVNVKGLYLCLMSELASNPEQSLRSALSKYISENEIHVALEALDEHSLLPEGYEYDKEMGAILEEPAVKKGGFVFSENKGKSVKNEAVVTESRRILNSMRVKSIERAVDQEAVSASLGKTWYMREMANAKRLLFDGCKDKDAVKRRSASYDRYITGYFSHKFWGGTQIGVSNLLKYIASVNAEAAKPKDSLGGDPFGIMDGVEEGYVIIKVIHVHKLSEEQIRLLQEAGAFYRNDVTTGKVILDKVPDSVMQGLLDNKVIYGNAKKVKA